MECDHCTIVHTGAIVEIPPPSYEEALEIIRKDAGSKLQEAPGSEFERGEVHAIPLETLRGDPSKWIQPAPPQYSTAVRDVEVTQATGTGLSRETNTVAECIMLETGHACNFKLVLEKCSLLSILLRH